MFYLPEPIAKLVLFGMFNCDLASCSTSSKVMHQARQQDPTLAK